MTIQECKEELGKRKDKGRDGDRNAGRGEEEKRWVREEGKNRAEEKSRTEAADIASERETEKPAADSFSCPRRPHGTSCSCVQDPPLQSYKYTVLRGRGGMGGKGGETHSSSFVLLLNHLRATPEDRKRLIESEESEPPHHSRINEWRVRKAQGWRRAGGSLGTGIKRQRFKMRRDDISCWSEVPDDTGGN